MVAKITPEIAEQDGYKFGFNDNDNATYSYRTEKGLSEDIVREISRVKNEPQWMTDFRVRSYQHFLQKPMPTGFWGGSIQNYNLDFNDIYYFARASDRSEQDWSDVPEYIKDTFDKLGIPEAEKKSLIAGVGAQYDSEVVYHSIREDLEKLGVIFTDTDSAVRDYPELFRKYFGTIIPPADNKFAALNSAVWSGGSFVYVPAGVKVDIPLQAYFRINKENMGQFERTLIIAEEGSYVHYVEGCTAPTYSTDALHSAVVEIVVKKNARVRYTTIQNWSTNVYNLVTKRAAAYENAVMEWVDGNLGLAADDEVPERLPDGAGRARRGPFAGDGVERATPGRGREDGARGAEHDLDDHLEVGIARQRPDELPRCAEGVPGREGLARNRALRRASDRQGVALRHVPADGDRRRASDDRARGVGLARR